MKKHGALPSDWSPACGSWGRPRHKSAADDSRRTASRGRSASPSCVNGWNWGDPRAIVARVAIRVDSVSIQAWLRKPSWRCVPDRGGLSGWRFRWVRRSGDQEHSREPSLKLSPWITRPPKRCLPQPSNLYNSQVTVGWRDLSITKALTTEFEKFGVAGLNNGLNPEENERLFSTTNLPEMIALVLRGLGRLGKPSVLALGFVGVVGWMSTNPSTPERRQFIELISPIRERPIA